MKYDPNEDVMKWMIEQPHGRGALDNFIRHCTGAAKFARQGRLAQAAWQLADADKDRKSLPHGEHTYLAIYLLGALEKAVGIHDEIAAKRGAT